MCETGPDVARKIPFIWIGTFGGFTVCCLLLATLAGGAVGTVVRPHRHDAVVFLSVGGNRSCPAGILQGGVVPPDPVIEYALSQREALGERPPLVST
jgi:hypothetical protein